MKSEERDTKKVHHDHIIIEKRLRLDIPSRSRVPNGFCDLFKFYKAIFKDDIFVAVLIFSSLKMSEFIYKGFSDKTCLQKSGQFQL